MSTSISGHEAAVFLRGYSRTDLQPATSSCWSKRRGLQIVPERSCSCNPYRLVPFSVSALQYGALWWYRPSSLVWSTISVRTSSKNNIRKDLKLCSASSRSPGKLPSMTVSMRNVPKSVDKASWSMILNTTRLKPLHSYWEDDAVDGNQFMVLRATELWNFSGFHHEEPIGAQHIPTNWISFGFSVKDTGCWAHLRWNQSNNDGHLLIAFVKQCNLYCALECANDSLRPIVVPSECF